MSFLAELKRRNVIRVALAYLAAAWLLIQVFETLLPVFGLSDTSIRYVFIVLAIGFVPAVIAAWVFELTPEGLTRDGGEASGIEPSANPRFDRIIIVTLVLAVTLFAAHTFIIDPARDAVRIEEATRDARTGAFKESFGEKSIAVLPFTDMSADRDQEYFGDGIAEELLNLLARVKGLRVISRTSSFQFKGSQLSLAEIAEQLDVATILEGSVRRSGNKIRITAQLIDAHADAHLWSDTYDRELADIFQIQDDVAAEVVEQLKVTLAVGPPKASRHNPEAYPLYLQAKYIVDLDDPDRLEIAEELLNRVLVIDPAYVDAELVLGFVYRRRAWKAGLDGNDTLAEELTAKRKKLLQAVQAEFPGNATLNAALGWDALMERNDHAAAARYLEIAIEAEPRNYYALLLAMALSGDVGQTDLTIKIGEFMARREPMGFWVHANLASAYLASGQNDKAIATLGTAAALSPKAEAIQWKLGIALLMSGEPQAALAYFEREEHLMYLLHGKALALHDLGDHVGSAAALTELLHIYKDMDDEVKWDFGLARAYAWMGDADKAFEYLYQTRQRHPTELFGFADNPYFQQIKADPRWQPLVDSIEQEMAKVQFNPKLPPEILATQ